jgi:hypothetical protein
MPIPAAPLEGNSSVLSTALCCCCRSGTTTATVLARAILNEGCKSVAAGMNPMDLRRGINLAVDNVLQVGGHILLLLLLGVAGFSACWFGGGAAAGSAADVWCVCGRRQQPTGRHCSQAIRWIYKSPQAPQVVKQACTAAMAMI